MERKQIWRFARIGCAVVALSVSGCSLQPAAHDTVGEQLIDLGRARDDGQLSDQEYARLHAKIVSDASSGTSSAASRPTLAGGAVAEAVRNVSPRW
jgi:hypothetical protein